MWRSHTSSPILRAFSLISGGTFKCGDDAHEDRHVTSSRARGRQAPRQRRFPRQKTRIADQLCFARASVPVADGEAIGAHPCLDRRRRGDDPGSGTSGRPRREGRARRRACPAECRNSAKNEGWLNRVSLRRRSCRCDAPGGLIARQQAGDQLFSPAARATSDQRVVSLRMNAPN